VIINRDTRQIICVDQDKGHVHDFELYKKTIGSRVCSSIRLQADYQGIDKIVGNCEIPKKKKQKSSANKT
jgi:hypothetical protein